MNVKEIETQSVALIEQAQMLIITDENQYKTAVELGKTIKEAKKEALSYIDPIVEKAHQAHKEAKAQQKRLMQPFDEAIGIIKQLGSDYQAEKRRLEDIARKEAEKKAKEEEEQRKKELEDMAEAEGCDVIADAFREEAEKTRVKPEYVPPSNSKGVLKNWKYKIVDEYKIPREYFILDEKRIGALVRAEKDKCKIDGIEVYFEENIRI